MKFNETLPFKISRQRAQEFFRKNSDGSFNQSENRLSKAFQVKKKSKAVFPKIKIQSIPNEINYYQIPDPTVQIFFLPKFIAGCGH